MKRALSLLCLILVAGAAAFYFYSHRNRPSLALPVAPGPPPRLFDRLPAGAPVVAYIDVAALRASPFSAELVALAPAPAQDRDYSEFVRSTGFDYSRDLDRVAVAMWPGPRENSAVAIAEGRFDREKITAFALRSGTVSKRQGLDVYEIRTIVAPRTPPKAISFAFLAPDRIVLADGAGLDAVLAPPASSPLDPTMRGRIERVAGAAFFAAARTDDLPKALSLEGMHSEQLNAVLRSIRGLSLAGQPEGERLKVTLDAECDSTKNAFQLSTLLEGFRWIGRAALADPKTRRQLQPQAAFLFDTLLRVAEVTHEGQRVRLRLDLTPQMLGAAAASPAH